MSTHHEIETKAIDVKENKTIINKKKRMKNKSNDLRDFTPETRWKVCQRLDLRVSSGSIVSIDDNTFE